MSQERDQEVSTHPVADSASTQIISFLLDRAPGGLVEAIISSAATDDPRWQSIVNGEFSLRVLASPKLQQDFFGCLLGKKPPKQGAPIIDAYLCGLGSRGRSEFFDAKRVRSKAHPVRMAIHGASFQTDSGRAYLGALSVFVQHCVKKGLLGSVLERSREDFARACLQGNRDFLALVMPELAPVPEALLVAVVERQSPNTTSAVNLLSSEFAVPMSQFASPGVLSRAHRETANFIIAMHARLNPIAESPYQP